MKKRAEKYNINKIRKKAENLMIKGFKLTKGKYVPPSLFHLGHQFRWDSGMHSIICSELGLDELAKNEIKQLLKKQMENGFIPNMIFLRKKPFFFEYERFSFNKKELHSNYTQPPLEAQALEWIQDKEFSKEIFNKILKAYIYFINEHDPDKDSLISVFHPHETGRDSDPTFDKLKEKIAGFYFPSIVADKISAIKINWKYKKIGWDIKKIAKMNLFDVEDVMFNCLWVQGMYCLARIARKYKIKTDIKKINALAKKTENAIHKLMYDKIDEMFYALDRENNKIRCETISNYFPIILPNINKNILDKLIKNLTDKKKFWLPYPLPCVPADNPKVLPNFKIWHGIWRGCTWLNMNFFIGQGLCEQAKRFKEPRYKKIAEHIFKQSLELVNKSGFRECYNSYTGQGYRAENFGWSALVVTFPILLKKDRE